MIYCIGDSFTYGSELADRNLSAWPTLIGNLLKKPVTNLGKQCVSTQYALKQSIECVYKNDAELIIVAWPNYNRTEFFVGNKVQDFWPGRNTESIDGVTEKQLIKILTQEHSYEMDLWNCKNWLLNIILLQTFFQVNKQQYVMLNTSRFHGNPNPEDDPSIQYLFNHIDNTYFLGWQGDGMTQWCEKCPKGPGYHPLEQGHQIIAEKIYNYIKKVIIK